MIGFFQGTFDILNAGHVRAFAWCKERCDFLIIGLNTDAIVKSERNREAIIPYVQRKEILCGIRDIDLVIPADDIYAFPFLMALEADVYFLTEEWKDRQEESLAYMSKEGRAWHFSPRFDKTENPILCSSDIRRRVREIDVSSHS